MSDTVIKVEDLGKLYKLGEITTGTISHDLKRWWASVRGKEDPFAKIGAVNDRTEKGTNDDYVWALKDVNFEVKRGEALGIIGRNGAGKSTLLKLLSKVTSPSTGSIKVKGRLASLLEVGTGFHPELTGRENIFLNGAILGMTKAEIRSKFDEIVDFAGVEKYIDTPVKRYSSGMYVRLAFAVAAHLEPEILIVDEVLAVGDAEFQKKCLGKMKDVSERGGRTVLFVSHNMAAIQNLCTKCLLMSKGSIDSIGDTSSIISIYNNQGSKSTINVYKDQDLYIDKFYIHSIIDKEYVHDSVLSMEDIELNLEIVSKFEIENVNIGYGINDGTGVRLITPFSQHSLKNYKIEKGLNKITCIIPSFPLKPGFYQVEIYVGNDLAVFQYYDDGLRLEVVPSSRQNSHSIPDSSQGSFIINQIWS